MASLYEEAKEFASSLTAIPGRQAYFLEVPGTDSAAQLSVVSFGATEMMGEPNVVTIEVTHPQQLARADYLNRDAAFRIVADDGVTRKFSGYIERFSTVQTTKDYTKYEVVLKSHFGRLQGGANTQVFQHLTIPQIIQKILRAHGIRDHQMLFRLRGSYPKLLWRFQYQMTDFDYVHMLMEKSGIYCYIVETEYGDQIVLGDDIDHYIYDPRLIVPYREAAGLEAGGAEAVKALKTHTEIVPQSFVVADYNPEVAWERYKDQSNIAPQDPTTYGQPYIYGTGHLDQAGAKWEAQLRHEAAIARQVIYEGESNVLTLQCARVLETDIVLPDAPKGQVITEITHSGAREKSYSNTYKAIPAERRFRLQLEPAKWAKIAGTLSARVCSPDKYTYGYLNAAGYYVVRLDADFGDWPRGGESVPLRLAKPFAGKLQTGMHFVALDNDEAKITFRDGDPDKPEISGFHHHSQARDLVTSDRRWLSRNMIRTQSNNKLRMEDWEGQEGIKLSTEHSGKSQLNLGYLVDNKLTQRGEGYELRTSGYGVNRAGKGLHLTTYDRPAATGKQLDMQETIAQLENALEVAKALAASASTAGANPADTDAQQQAKNDLDGLKKPGILMSTPASAAVVAGDGAYIVAQNGISAISGQNADISVAKRLTVAAGELISMFAERLGIKLFAAKGKVQIQAQDDEMDLQSNKDMTISSANGRVVIEAKTELLLKCGGSYIRLSSTGIEDGTRGDRTIKSAAFSRQGPASLAESMNAWKHANFNDAYVIRNPSTGEPLANTAIELIRGDGTRLKMVTDAAGNMPTQKSLFVEGLRIRTLD
jgi:type VI secretion system secreted protein VgrG